MNDFPKIDKKQLLDPKVFEKAIKIITSKAKKPREEFWSRKAIRYDWLSRNHLRSIICRSNY